MASACRPPHRFQPFIRSGPRHDLACLAFVVPNRQPLAAPPRWVGLSILARPRPAKDGQPYLTHPATRNDSKTQRETVKRDGCFGHIPPTIRSPVPLGISVSALRVGSALRADLVVNVTFAPRVTGDSHQGLSRSGIGISGFSVSGFSCRHFPPRCLCLSPTL